MLALRLSRVLATVSFAVVLAGYGIAASASAAVTSAPIVPASFTSPTQGPAPAPPPTRASDGTNYAVCAKRACEVAVSAPVRIPVRGGTLAVTRVGPDGLDFQLDVGGGGGSGTIKDACGATSWFGASGGGGTSCRADMLIDPLTPKPGTTALQTVNRVNGTWILRIASA